MAEYNTLTHIFEPVYNQHSKVLILGTFPSVKSRENHFYYGHPQNRFWKVISALTDSALPQTVDEKKMLLLQNGIAVWDVIARCTIAGSSDSSIRDVEVNDISKLLAEADIRQIYGNGGKAWELYMKYAYPKTGREMIKLPSTSPANASFQLDRLCAVWKEHILPYL